MRKSNYDKFPATEIEGEIITGWDAILSELKSLKKKYIVIELYSGVYEEEVINTFSDFFGEVEVVITRDLMKSEKEIREMTDPFMTDDVLFGYLSNIRIPDFFNKSKLEKAKQALIEKGHGIVIGTGASLVCPQSEDVLLVYIDMARWEIQQRFRRHEVKGIGIDNHEDPVSIQYKRGYFIDWHALDLYKDKLFQKVDFWIDTHIVDLPKMISGETFMKGIELTVSRPFRVVPFFDPAPWGGQWMKEVCDLDREKQNFGWCFDCVPEENSLYFKIKGILFELPSVDLVLLRSRKLLGEPVEGRFGKDFPIRFDFLDTIGGGNLSLQVHPTTQFVHENFGIPYTQDESYYLLDANEEATVYLGLKKGINPNDMISDLKKAQRGEIIFDAEKYVNKWPAKKHDHFLIPGGTIHCSGSGGMVLEISTTPNLFTFKLWDWQRLGLDGKPRPINVERGSQVIDWGRDTDYVRDHLRNHFKFLASGENWEEIRTGLHPNEFIETRRLKFSVPVKQETFDSVNVCNLVEGDEAVISSQNGEFKPFVVHYAETFIIPAHIHEYIIAPHGPSEGKDCMVIKAFVRF